MAAVKFYYFTNFFRKRNDEVEISTKWGEWVERVIGAKMDEEGLG